MRSLASKVKSPHALQLLLRKSPKKRVVFTNGCFDLLHKGHTSYLERAKKQGDVLIVALNSDASVERLKGVGRPLNTLADRMDVLSALESVDYVTWFEEDTPLALILKIKPKVLVKGGDWKTAQIVGAKEVLSWGGKVRSLPYIEGQSTTRLIARARGQ